MSRYNGVVPPVITPLKLNGEVDFDSLTRMIEYLSSANVHGLFVLGTTSEVSFHDDATRRKIISHVAKVNGGRLPLFVGAIDSGTDRSIGHARIAKDLGATAIVATVPFYATVDQAEIIDHYRYIRESVAMDLFAYDIPACTHTKLQHSTIVKLAHEGVIVGLKDSSGDDQNLRRVLLDSKWAAQITQITDVSQDTIERLARNMAGKRTFLMMSWSPYWILVTLATMLGQMGKPGQGYGFGYGALNNTGYPVRQIKWPSFPQGPNPLKEFVPVARISDMLLHPGEEFHYNGGTYSYPEIELAHWVGGNPFHHHQDINRFLRAWRKPEVAIAHERFWNPLAKHAHIVFPVAMLPERNDIICSSLENAIFPSHKVCEPAGEARTDFEIFLDLASRLGIGPEYGEGCGEEEWLRRLYQHARESAAIGSVTLPPFDEFWLEEGVDGGPPERWPQLLEVFLRDPNENPLRTPSGKIEIYSKTIAGFGYDDCVGHAARLEPKEWLGPNIGTDQLHLLSNQPPSRLHSQFDNNPLSRSTKVNGREPARMNPADATRLQISDGGVIRIYNERGACLAGVVLPGAIRQGIIQLSTGAWYDPIDPSPDGSLDVHGNPNVLTADRGTSALAQGPNAQSCLVRIERFEGELPPIRAFEPPSFVELRTDEMSIT